MHLDLYLVDESATKKWSRVGLEIPSSFEGIVVFIVSRGPDGMEHTAEYDRHSISQDIKGDHTSKGG